MIRLLHVITSLEVGGAQRMLVKLCERMDRSRFEPAVVSLLDGGALREDLTRSGVAVESLGMRSGWPDPRAIRRLARVLERRQPQVVQSWLYHADLVATAALRSVRRASKSAAPSGSGTIEATPAPRLAWNLRCTHAPGSASSLVGRMAPRLCAWASRSPEVIVTNSQAGRETHEAIGYRPRSWRFIPNGFDLDVLHPDPDAGSRLRSELGLQTGHVLIGMLARWHPMKEHTLVLQLAGELAGEHPALRFVLAGAGVEPGEQGFDKSFADAGSPGNVIALGMRRDVPDLCAGFDLLLSASSSYEGFPNVLGEALACGTPCVTTDVGDSAAVVGEAGRVVRLGDREALGRAIVELACMQDEERRALGALGRERMREQFELGDVVQSYEALYRELAEATPCAV